jgi:hypothetical protein
VFWLVVLCCVGDQAAVAAKGGIEAVVAAMRAHVGVAAVQEQGCGALENIASLQENKVRPLYLLGANLVA